MEDELKEEGRRRAFFLRQFRSEEATAEEVDPMCGRAVIIELR